MECGALSSMKHELKLDFGFAIRANLLAYTEVEYLFSQRTAINLAALMCTHSEYLHTGG